MICVQFPCMRDGAERRAHPDFISLGSFGNIHPVHSSACKYRWDRKGSDWKLQECMEESVSLHLENFDISSGVMCKNAKYESQKQISQGFFCHCHYSLWILSAWLNIPQLVQQRALSIHQKCKSQGIISLLSCGWLLDCFLETDLGWMMLHLMHSYSSIWIKS